MCETDVMKRDVSALGKSDFDIVVVGGGIFGICIAWDAVLRGLSVALIEKGDFGHATSARHFKVVHGGIRYLQHADFLRVRESSRERTALLKNAPHLVHPLPFVVPTYGHGLKGRGIMRAALALYGWCTFDRNRAICDAARRIPAGFTLSRQAALNQFPQLNPTELSGAAVFYDGQMYNPARLSLAFVHSLVNAGGCAVNYAEVVQFLRQGDQITGVAVRDRLEGEALEVRAKMVVNASGPWAKWLLKEGGTIHLRQEPVFSRDAYFILNRKLTDTHALAIQGATRDPDALLSRGNRHLFLVPWRDYTLVGVWHKVFAGRPETVRLSEAEVVAFIDEVNAENPGLELSLDDVSMVNAGLTLFGENRPGAKNLSYGKRSLLIDHEEEHGLNGLISVVGVRFTTARGVAEKVVNLVQKKLQREAGACVTFHTPLVGGEFDSFAALVKRIEADPRAQFGTETAEALAHNHGSEFEHVLALCQNDPSLAVPLGNTSVLAAEIVFAARNEMACRLSDVVLRRTDLGTGAFPGERSLRACATLMANELKWDANRIEQEITAVSNEYPKWLVKSDCHNKHLRNGNVGENERSVAHTC